MINNFFIVFIFCYFWMFFKFVLQVYCNHYQMTRNHGRYNSEFIP
jgi:hypothetical protein